MAIGRHLGSCYTIVTMLSTPDGLSPGDRQLVYLNADLIAPNIRWEAADV